MADESDYFQSIFQNKTFVFICVSLFLFFGKKIALFRFVFRIEGLRNERKYYFFKKYFIKDIRWYLEYRLLFFFFYLKFLYIRNKFIVSRIYVSFIADKRVENLIL